MGARPEIYLTITRGDIPHFSTFEKPLDFGIRNIVDSQKSCFCYVMVTPKR